MRTPCLEAAPIPPKNASGTDTRSPHGHAATSTIDLKLGGIVITKVDTRKSYFKQTLETLKSLEDVPVFDTYIRVDSGIEWSQDNNAPIMAYKKSSRSAKEYMELTKEIARME